MAANTATGQLYIVATPIGNLDDMSQRAIQILQQVDLILAEDTRHSKKLLNHYGIINSMTSLHNHNENTKSEHIINKLLSGESIALISDAGTPLISDPGFPLVRLAKHHDITVSPIPGPCALTAALSACGLSTTSFCFDGFLPVKPGVRAQRLQALKEEPRTLCFYEAPHRLLDSLSDISTYLGADRSIVVAKELTKSYERFFEGPVSLVLQTLEANPSYVKGEFVILIEGHSKPQENQGELDNILNVLLEEGISTKQAANSAAKLTGVKRKAAYQRALTLMAQQPV